MKTVEHGSFDGELQPGAVEDAGYGIAATDFNAFDFFGDDTTESAGADDSDHSIDSDDGQVLSIDDRGSEKIQVSALKSVLQVSSEKTEKRFRERVSVAALDKGLSVVGSLVQVFGQLAASCGPLCLHALSGASSAMSGAAAASGGLGSVASIAGGLSFDGNGNVSFSGSLDSLARKTGYSADAIRSGKVSVSDLIAALSMSFGNGMGVIFGFGILDTLMNIIPEGKAA